MAGSFAEAREQILSLRPAILRARAGELREFGIDARLAGSQLAASADEVGSQRGAPYAAYRERVTPTATWLREIDGPATTAATGLDRSADESDRARMVLAQQEQMLAALAADPAVGPAQLVAAEARALAACNQAIDAVTRAYAAVAPPPPGRAPVVAGGTGAETAGTTRSGGVEAEPGALLGPAAGPFAGFVRDPLTGNLVDPGTGREVGPGGRFLDPITGQPFGEPSPFATRLEGLVGGGAAGLGGAVPAGVLGAGAGGVPVAGVAAGPGPTGAAGGGAVPFLPPAAIGAVGAARGGAGRFAGLYGGAVPPSLAGPNPAITQLHQAAAQNLEQKAAVAQRYAAIATGQPQAQAGYLPPPMMGVGGGGTGAARSVRRGGPRAVTEPAGVWGAVPGRDRWDRSPASRPAADTEDTDVWTGGGTSPAALLGGR